MALRRKKEEESPVAEASAPPPPPPPTGESPFSAHVKASGEDEHPEVLVGAAFAGGFALALIMKRFAR